MNETTPPDWERATLERIALKGLEEQRRARQWSALFKLLWFSFALLAALSFVVVGRWVLAIFGPGFIDGRGFELF